MGTFNLGWSVGVDSCGAPIEAVGHVGDTYGYQRACQLACGRHKTNTIPILL